MDTEARNRQLLEWQREAGDLPFQVRELAPREREIAQIVYLLGPITAHNIKERLSVHIANATVRTVLMRLVRKGIVQRRKLGDINKYVYAAAITDHDAQQRALRRLSNDYFEGSLVDAAAAILDLLRTDARAGRGQFSTYSPQDS
jgi:predicted transcriptional regulator